MMANSFGNVMQLIGAADGICALMEYEPKVNTQGGDRIEREQIGGNIELEDVYFKYPSKPDVTVLKGVSFSVNADANKRVIALCGSSGCGKSSIISMLERFYDPDQGLIKFNGVNIKDLDPRWYHNQIAIVQ